MPADPFFDKERTLALLYNHTREFFLLLDRNLCIRLYNRITFEHLRDHAAIEICRGMPLTRLLPALRQAELAGYCQKALSGVFQETELEFRSHSTGLQVFLHIFFQPVPDSDGRTAALMVTAHDITARKQTQATLARSEEQWRFAIEGSNLGLWDRDLTSNRFYYSPSYHRLYGFREGMLRPDVSEWQTRVHPEDLQAVLRAKEAYLQGRVPAYECTYRLQDAAGNYRWIKARGLVVTRDETGRPVRMIGTHSDITSTVEAERQLALSEQKYRLLFDQNPLPCLIVDAQSLQIIRSNREAGIFYDRSPSDLQGLNLESLWEDSRSPGELRRRLELPRSLPHRITWSYNHPDGRLIYLEVHSELITYEERPARIILIKDITDQIQAEQALQHSHERFLLASRAASDALYDWDLSMETIYWGDGMQQLFGYTPEEVTFTYWETLVHPEDRTAVVAGLHLVLADTGQDYWKSEYRFYRKDGTFADVLDRGYVLRNESGKAIRMIGAMQDVSEQKQKERELVEQNRRFDMVLRATNDLIWDWNLETNVIYRDPHGLERVYGVATHTNLNRFDHWLERVHPDDQSRIAVQISDLLHSGTQQSMEMEYRFRRDDGQYVLIYDRGLLLRNAGGQPNRLIGAAHDITERRKLEQELLARELNRQRVISQATIETQERERAEIGKELHDNVNQVLTTTKLYLDLSMSHPEMREELLTKSSRNIIYVINEIRQLSRSLMNPSLGDLGLVDSINDLVEGVHLTKKLRVDVSIASEIESCLSDHQKLVAYRIIQEALNNALRHSRATRAEISAEIRNQELQLTVKDDGIGFDTTLVKKGAGLRNIENRVYLASGTLQVDSRPQQGCLLQINIPLKTEAN